jgi:hypothetical protein
MLQAMCKGFGSAARDRPVLFAAAARVLLGFFKNRHDDLTRRNKEAELQIERID